MVTGLAKLTYCNTDKVSCSISLLHVLLRSSVIDDGALTKIHIGSVESNGNLIFDGNESISTVFPGMLLYSC